MSTVSAHVATALAQHISVVFGVMGQGNAHFLDAWETSTEARFVAVRHEAAGVVAADAHYRAGGGLAVATTTYGAGFTNTLTALAESAMARIPLVLVVGDHPTSGPRPWDVDQSALASAVGARTYTVGRDDAATTVAIAVAHALTYRVPAVLALPYDIAALEAGTPASVASREVPPPLEPSAFTRHRIADVAARLARARRPLILAGRGAWLAGAGSLLNELASATGALTATTALGCGLFTDRDRDLGVAGGFGAEGAMSLVRDADIVVAVGASLNQFTMRFGELFSPGSDVVQIDVTPVATHPHVGTFLRGDASRVVRRLLDELRAQDAPVARWRDDVDLAAARHRPLGHSVAAQHHPAVSHR